MSEEQLEQITQMASAAMKPAEIAIMLNLPPEQIEEFENTVKFEEMNQITLAYKKGLLQTKYELRQKIIKLAKQGSPAAEPIALKFLKEVDL